VMSNCIEYLELLYATWFAGAAVVPINFKLHAKEAAWIIENAEAKAVFVSNSMASELIPLVERLPRLVATIVVGHNEFAALRTSDPMPAPISRGRDDLAWLFYTSGTTGRPKGVMISNGNLHAMAFSYFVDVDEVRATDATLYAAPMSHGAGIYNFMHVMRGARHVVPESGGFEADEVLALARSLRDISMFAAPTMVRRLVDRAKSEGSSGDGIRTVVYGGGPMYVADIEEAVAVMGPRFVQIYGQGESPMTITALSRALVADRSHPRWCKRLGSVGVAQSCVDVRIGDEGGRRLPAGETGEILVRGAPVMLGYWRNPEATAKTIRDGWLWTGDIGSMDDDGFLTLKDRSKDVIISGGSNIYPREVEEALLLHPAVREVSVVGQPSEEWGEDVVAFVVAKPGVKLDRSDLDHHCLEHIARFKRPKSYIFEVELPKNNYGKVLKTELRARLATRNDG
jgi:acyl-CoA synthetase (AMP-forming)/AMP-acid ligase II